MSLDSGGLFMILPWEKKVNNLPFTVDESILQLIAHRFADAYPSMYQSNDCQTSRQHGVFHGTDLNNNRSGIMDKVYSEYHSLMISAHISCCRFPPPSQLPELWKKSLQPLMDTILKTKQGLYGKVVNASGNPIEGAVITFDQPPTTVNTSSTGEFYTIMIGGTHRIRISAEGYETQTQKVVIDSDTLSEKDIVLNRDVSVVDYHTPGSMKSFLTNITGQCKDLTRLHSLGKSAKNQDIWMLDLGSVSEDRKKSASHILLVAGIHGNEAVGPELLLQLAFDLCENYGKDYEITSILNESEVHIIASLNPDGVVKSKKGECKGTDGLTNGNNVDLDQNFPSKFVNSTSEVQPETEVLMKWMEDNQPSLVVILRGGSLVTTYPYHTHSKNAILGVSDLLSFRHLGSVYINSHPVMKDNKFGCDETGIDFGNGVIPASKIHSHNGSLLDYVYDFIHANALVVYTGCCNYPDSETLLTTWHQHRTSLIQIVKEGGRGITGLVQDGNSNAMKNATVTVEGSRHSYPVDTDGRFHIYLPPGHYTLIISCHGYKDSKKKLIIAEDKVDRKDVVIFLEKRAELGLSSFGIVFIIAVVVLVVVVVITILLCVQSRRSYKSKGFSRLNFDDEEDEDFAIASYHSKSKLLNGGEYRDYSTDEDEEHNLYEQQKSKH
ncbi:hypothetical protein KUTeg_009871 [Tegillarca granosa]|uniref:Peptidase M14 domain-containing protein n=1 Tax=Tegillarca granosa TaxID=220873 RepID=A0ABQ9F536_TEGGR|nr:hypothetical protein KUTeg_009871 [Tegillarca granosa]